MTRHGALEAIKAVYDDRTLAAKAWAGAGGKVVGHLGGGTPEALIMAAGFLPYQLTGDPDADLSALDWALYPIFNKQQATRGLIELEWVNTILAQLFSGRFDFLDYLVIPCSRKEISQINAHVRDARAAYPNLRLPEVYLLDRAMQPNYAASTFNRATIVDFKGALEAWAGRAITDEDLQAAIELCAAHRGGLEQLLHQRCTKPCGISGVDAQAVLITSKLMSKADHLALTRAIAAEPIVQSDALRVLIAGSPQDHSLLHALVETFGAEVVADAEVWGDDLVGPPFAPDVTPLDLIADRYHLTPPSYTMPISKESRRCADLAAKSQADAVVFYVHRHDDLQRFTTPDEISAVKALGLPVLYLAEQPYRPGDAARAELGSFLSQVKSSKRVGGAVQ